MAIFPGGPGLFWILLELRMTEVVVTTGAIRHAKFQSNRYQQPTNTQLFIGWMVFLSPNQQHQSSEGKSRVLLVMNNICHCTLDAFHSEQHLC